MTAVRSATAPRSLSIVLGYQYCLNLSPSSLDPPGARLLSPLSSLTVLDESGNLRLQVSGIGGGVAGLAGAVMATYRHLWLKELPYEAVSSPVVIPNLKTPSIVHESKMDKKLLDDAWNGPAMLDTVVSKNTKESNGWE